MLVYGRNNFNLTLTALLFSFDAIKPCFSKLFMVIDVFIKDNGGREQAHDEFG